MTDLLFYTLDELAEAKRDAYTEGWNDAIDFIRSMGIEPREAYRPGYIKSD